MSIIVESPSGDARVSADLFKAIIDWTKGKHVRGGFSMTHPTPGGFGKWIRDH